MESRPHACGADDIAASPNSTAIHTASAWMMCSIHSRIEVPVRRWVSLDERQRVTFPERRSSGRQRRWKPSSRGGAFVRRHGFKRSLAAESAAR